VTEIKQTIFILEEGAHGWPVQAVAFGLPAVHQ